MSIGGIIMSLEEEKSLLNILNMIKKHNDSFEKELYGAKIELMAVHHIEGYNEDEMEYYEHFSPIGIESVKACIKRREDQAGESK
jgi:hypothetical protein